MNRSAGISDLRLLKVRGISSLEKVGLLLSILSSSISPFSFSWQIKGLLSRGLLELEHGYILFAIGTLSIT